MRCCNREEVCFTTRALSASLLMWNKLHGEQRGSETGQVIRMERKLDQKTVFGVVFFFAFFYSFLRNITYIPLQHHMTHLLTLYEEIEQQDKVINDGMDTDLLCLQSE